MSVSDIVVLLASAIAVAGLGWFFFAPRRARAAELGDGVQRVEVTVRGGYRPDVIRVRQGVPLEMVFDRQESGECTSRVVFPDFAVSAVLPAPVLFAVMAREVFKADWVPALLLNHWLQLALITPVMFYTGWPIHRTGWLALANRGAEMNSLITLGTTAAYAYSLLVTVAPGVLPAEVREVYFEAVSVILTLILLGRLIEARDRKSTRL